MNRLEFEFYYQLLDVSHSVIFIIDVHREEELMCWDQCTRIVPDRNPSERGAQNPNIYLRCCCLCPWQCSSSRTGVQSRTRVLGTSPAQLPPREHPREKLKRRTPAGRVWFCCGSRSVCRCCSHFKLRAEPSSRGKKRDHVTTREPRAPVTHFSAPPSCTWTAETTACVQAERGCGRCSLFLLTDC
ncbi:hypothetical protein GOODEAATRI_018888 [Goodea atripinnis]|uniref:Uncharacterized protein n=1 Tax=Goodea atripinnis TaxID=208336 RepID=A0ABV0N5S7_9TELE